MTNEVKIILTPITAEKYKQFLLNYDNICTLIDDRVFETRGADCVLNFDESGRIKKVVTNRVIFHK